MSDDGGGCCGFKKKTVVMSCIGKYIVKGTFVLISVKFLKGTVKEK